MRSFLSSISLLAVSVAAVTSLAVAPVAAENSRAVTADTQTSMSHGMEMDSQSSTEVADSTTSEHASMGMSTSSSEGQGEQKDVTSLKAQAAQLLQKDRQNKKAKSVADRQKACQAHLTELQTREANYAKAGQTHYNTFTDIYNKVLAYQAQKNLTVSNYATLKTNVDTAQATAQAAVTTLGSTNVQVDCTAQDPAASLAVLKTAVSTARQDLQAYRTAIKNLIVAMLKAQGSTTSASTSTTTSTTTTTSTGSNQ